MSDLAQFKVDLLPNGRADVIVNGENVSDRVSGLTVQAKIGSPPVVMLYQFAGSSEISGEGVVQVAMDGGSNRAAVIREFLDHVDSGALEAAVLEGADFSSSVMDDVLAVLKRMADAQP